jgi:hypothetical protein
MLAVVACTLAATSPWHLTNLLSPFTDKHEAKLDAPSSQQPEQSLTGSGAEDAMGVSNYTMTQQEEKLPGAVDGWAPPPKPETGPAPVKEADYEVYGWWDVDCGLQGQPVCKSFKGDKGWCMVSPLGSANRTMLVPAPKADGKAYCEKCGGLGLPACPTMNGTSYCFPEDEVTGAPLLPSFYASDPKPGVYQCIACGSEGQLACSRKGAPYCNTGSVSAITGALPFCGPCGGADEPACVSTEGPRFCLEGGTVIGGLCHSSAEARRRLML